MKAFSDEIFAPVNPTVRVFILFARQLKCAFKCASGGDGRVVMQ